VAYDLGGLGAGAGQFSKSKTVILSYFVKKPPESMFRRFSLSYFSIVTLVAALSLPALSVAVTDKMVPSF
jgi:hypothetical protein